jgi:nitroreductase
MENTQWTELSHIIETRRSVSWAKMNGRLIPDETMKAILALGDWAPTHGRTEPWRFFVYAGDAKTQFGIDHGNLYWENTAEDKRLETTRQKLETNVALASHVVITAMKRGENDKIPGVEELAATAAAIQNTLLGATALGIASFWSTGGMAHRTELKTYLGLGEHDHILGILYFGYTDEPAKEGVRKVAIEEKIIWK